MKELFEMLAAYNRWANERIYDAAARLADADYRADRGAFFGSLHGTLNHLLAGDRIWMRRFTGEGEMPARLDAILYDDLDELRAARQVEDTRIIAYVARLREADLTDPLRYRTVVAATDIEQRLADALLHFFNHQTHHRGQAHGILTALTDEAPSLDLVVFQRVSGMGMIKGTGGDFARPDRRPGAR